MNAGQGLENLGTEDMQIPFMRIVQPLSPQLMKNDAKFIKGISAGDIFNNVTGEFWEADEGVVVIPCAYQMKYLEFQLRENGGGYMGELDPLSPDVHRTQRVGSNEILPSGNELVRSAQFLLVTVGEDGRTSELICDMKKTQMKVSKQWNARRAGLQIMHPTEGLFNPPIWMTAWRLNSVQESNDKGSWYNYAVSNVDIESVPEAAIKQARTIYDRFQKGEIKTSGGTEEEMSVSSSEPRDDIPF
jgi:hypothetical protein